MTKYTAPIQDAYTPEKDEELPLDLLRTALANTKPGLIRQAAEEFASVRFKLGKLVEVLDLHLVELDKSWPTGADAQQVKGEFRRLRDSTAAIMEVIANDGHGQPSTNGIAPALAAYSDTLSLFRGDHVPGNAGQDVSVTEGAFEWGMGGAGIGLFVGGPPGAVIGGVLGSVAGGITSLFSEVPFLDMFGESKEEKDRKAAKKHLKNLNQVTSDEVIRRFPPKLDTDIPEFDVPMPKIGDPKPPGGTMPSGDLPDTFTAAYDPNRTIGGLPGTPGIDGLDLPGGGYGDTGGFNLNGPKGPGGITPVDPGDLSGNTDPGSIDGSTSTDGNGLGDDGTIGSGTGAGTGDGRGNGDTTTTLAGHNPWNTGTSPYTQTGFGTTDGGTGAGTGGGYGGSAGGSVPGSGRGSGRGGLGGASMLPIMPQSGAGSGNEESERTTWLLEDDDVFTSDAKVTQHLIDDSSKGKA
ncbi:DUF456 domain-containing protein [Nonomuraea sp. NPDC046570]|uniref:DUF456 domain-containing protein n=1 Tax=Nonomuraea sp. NPDC046570 TaxID=3155255 RepID=UPI0033CFE3FA